ncbi:hypothetical protein FHU36_001307 [Nonomuraea muscovyensis]|uniref:Uncharacterized protein n=1 Tax=Nonomuraea muscovyensis TaxID=1124761 RepID=A0A7X0BY79_9ACTN|nr:hypothetical protein [Nonomuraea muscovyensis]MBB6344798.1 hypothetical protein [Nonomuraea muscovyensis]
MSDVIPHRSGWAAVLRRWPTALAVGTAAARLAGGSSDGEITALAEVAMLLPLVYLVVAGIRRRGASWPTLGALVVLYVGLRTLDVVPTPAVLAGVSLAVLVRGAVSGDLRSSGAFRLQALGVLGFGALALAALVAEPDLGRYLVAAGWLLHGVWDFVHLRRNAVVSRSYAEWCGVFDVLIAAQLVFLA